MQFHLNGFKPGNYQVPDAARKPYPDPPIKDLPSEVDVRFPLSLRNVEDLLHERGIDISHETVRFWWNRFGPLFAAEIRRNRVSRMRSYSNWQWHLRYTVLQTSDSPKET